jgi:D-alanyl-lipoteichoic acid acyltransferase DltB (MBOAT superfamily)
MERVDRWMAIAIGFLIFLSDWSGFRKWEPDLFFPKPIREVWWHLPLEVGGTVLAFQLAELIHRHRDRTIRGVTGWIAISLATVTLLFMLFTVGVMRAEGGYVWLYVAGLSLATVAALVVLVATRKDR